MPCGDKKGRMRFQDEPPVDPAEFARSVAATSPECIAVIAPDGRLLQINPAGLSMIGAVSFEEVEQTAAVDLIAPEHRDAWLANHQRICGGEKLVWEFDLVGLKGVRRSMENHATPISLRDGTSGQLTVARDVAARIRSDKAMQLEAALMRLQESERSFELLVDSVTDYALYMLDPVGRVVSWNSGAQRIKGYEAHEIIGRHFEAFYSEADRAAGIPARGLITAAREGRLETEGWRVRKDGTRFWANVIIDAIRTDGNLIGFAKITRDITERRAAESRLRQAQKMEAVGQFTGGAAHDFNNLLMAVLGNLEILRKRLPDDPRLLTLLDNAVLGAKRGSSLTQRMLAFARRQELKQETVDLADLVNNMLELLERSLGSTIHLETHFPREGLRVRADVNQLETALLNLALNGRDAMPAGGTISISGREHSIDGPHPTNLPPGRYACLSVSDTGHGMDEATLGRATEPFFTTKGVGKGTGLGLSMVDGLTGQSGGKLMISSTPGRGTTIDLWLPISTDAAAAGEHKPAHDGRALESKRQLYVLAVDDDSLVLANVTAMLEDLGHRVISVPSGAKAIEAIASAADIDVLITDQVMPVMTGIQLIEELRSRRPGLPVILATGFAELPEGLDATIQRLSKPFTQRALAKALASSANLSQLIDVDQSFLAVEGEGHRPAAVGTDAADL
jgi:PAS domain S-box-containing protein